MFISVVILPKINEIQPIIVDSSLIILIVVFLAVNKCVLITFYIIVVCHI